MMKYKQIGQALEVEKVRLTEKLGKVSVNQEPVAHETLSGLKLEQLTMAEKLQCARDYFLTGNLSEIARNRGIFYNDLLELAREGIFQEEVANLEREANAQLKVKFTTVLGRTLEALEDRLAFGDWKVVDKMIERVPVSARDLTTIANTMFDKKKIIEDSEKGFGSTEAKKLLSIADALRHKGLEAKQVLGEVFEQAKED